jgi:hypothetical protein
MRREPIRIARRRDLLLGTFLQDGMGTHGGITAEGAVDPTMGDRGAKVMGGLEEEQGEAETEEEEEAEAVKED